MAAVSGRSVDFKMIVRRHSILRQLMNATASFLYLIAALSLESENAAIENRLFVLVLPVGIAISDYLGSPFWLSTEKMLSVVFFLLVAFATCTLFPPRSGQLTSVLAMIGSTACLVVLLASLYANFSPASSNE